MLVAQPDHTCAGRVRRIDQLLNWLVQRPPAGEHHQAAILEKFVDHINHDHGGVFGQQADINLLAVLGKGTIGRGSCSLIASSFLACVLEYACGSKVLLIFDVVLFCARRAQKRKQKM